MNYHTNVIPSLILGRESGGNLKPGMFTWTLRNFPNYISRFSCAPPLLNVQPVQCVYVREREKEGGEGLL